MIILLRRLLTLHEGLRLKPYLDTVGKLTIGVGRNLHDVGLFLDEADYLLDNDLKRAILALQIRLPWFDTLEDARKMVLVDMTFNMGIGWLRKFPVTVQAISEGRFEDASRYMLDSLWARQVKDRALRLSEMMRTGVLPSVIT